MRAHALLGALLVTACGGGATNSPATAGDGGSVLDVPAAQGDTVITAEASVGLDGSGGVDSRPVANPTWAEHVAPILNAQCVNCHRAGGIAPFALTTYAQAAEMARAIATETAARRMPPTVVNATGSCNEYRDDVRRLSEAQVQTLARWADLGAPQGDPSRAPAPPPPAAGLPRVDLRVDMGLSYTPRADRVDDYRCFLVDPGNATDRFITGYEVVPGDPRVVHHMILYTIPSAEAQRQAEALDARDATPGYECFGGPGVGNSAPLALWAPGGGATRFPARSGLRLTGGRKVVMQMHYNLAHGSHPDRTVVNLQTEASVPVQGILFPIVDQSIRLPPRMTEVVTSRDYPLSNFGGLSRVYIHGVAPHMHTLGRSMRVSAREVGEGATQCIVDVPRWDFHWQGLYFYRDAVVIERGQTANITCRYDTTTRSETTAWGEGTGDEMCLAYFYATAAPLR